MLMFLYDATCYHFPILMMVKCVVHTLDSKRFDNAKMHHPSAIHIHLYSIFITIVHYLL